MAPARPLPLTRLMLHVQPAHPHIQYMSSAVADVVADARVLIVSDAYPYTHQHEAGQCGMTAEEMPAAVRPEDTDVVIERALSWTRYVDAEVVIAELEAFLASYPADIIAPAWGSHHQPQGSHGGFPSRSSASAEIP